MVMLPRELNSGAEVNMLLRPQFSTSLPDIGDSCAIARSSPVGAAVVVGADSWQVSARSKLLTGPTSVADAGGEPPPRTGKV